MEQITRENYRDHPAINYSKLKALADHPRKVDEEIEMNKGMIFGDAMDCMLFTPEEFDDKFYVADLENLPSDNIQNIIDAVVEKHGLEITNETVLAEAKQQNYGSNWKDSTRLRKILEDGGGARYAEILLNSEDKHILSIDKHAEIAHAVEVLQNHEWTAPIIRGDLEDHQDRFTQYPAMSIGDYNFKALFDLIILDHDRQRIYPYDLKFTSRPVTHFDSEFIKRKYYIQAALYTHVLKIQTHNDTPLMVKGYNVMPFKFIVISSKDPNHPMIYTTTLEDIDCGLEGGELRSGREVKGVFQLAEELIWHEQENKWGYPYEVYQSDGELTLNVFG